MTIKELSRMINKYVEDEFFEDFEVVAVGDYVVENHDFQHNPIVDVVSDIENKKIKLWNR